MRIAVIQHVLRGSNEEDAVALGNAAADVCDMGAEVVIFPTVPVLADVSDGDPVPRLFEAIGEARPENVVFLNPSAAPSGLNVASLPLLGSTALLVGDATMDYQEILTASGKKPSVAILVPHSENELQAEAVTELAIGLSQSLAGLVVIAEAAGAEPGAPGHGGSAIIYLGDVVAEAMGEEDATLEFEVGSPVPQPEPRGLLPEIPTILSQRLASHEGRKPDTEYPADLN